MKKLNEYLTASEKQYEYRIKVAGDFPKETYNKFKQALDMFDVDKCTAPKKTPIQSSPLGFPDLTNEEVNIFDATLNYPANEEQIRALAKRCGIIEANIVIVLKDYDESVTKERDGVEDGTRLDTPEYPAQDADQKEASDDYADSYETAARSFAGDAKTEFEIAGEKTPPAKFNTDNDDGNDSPLSKVKREKLKGIK